MPTSKMEKEVRGFLGRLNDITEWNKECQEGFEKIKKYLRKPPTLVPLVLGRTLIMCLTVLEESMGYVLEQHDDSGRKK
ncbi:hypothetical protein CR513_03400, partial [Mucuna pruriens]